jgi:uncharacterized membrane protein YbhN (UPF0104 family)
LPALGALASTVALYTVLWRSLMNALDRSRPPLADSCAVFTSSWIGRYVPTSAPYVAGKVTLGGRLGYRRSAVGASIVYENLVVICVAALTSAVILPLTLKDVMPPLLWAVVGVPAACALFLLPSSALVRAVSRIAERFRLPSLEQFRLPGRGVAIAALIAATAAATNGAAFALLLAAFDDLSTAELIAAGAAFNLAGAAGVAAVPVPGGIGVREAVLVALLQAFVPIEVAAAAALLARLGAILVDLALGCAGAAWLASRGTFRDARAPASIDAAAEELAAASRRAA